MRPIGLEVLSRLPSVPHSVILKQTKHRVEPDLTPPLPAKTSTVAHSHQVAPYLPLHPVLHVGQTPTRMPNPEVVHPAPYDRIDHRNHPTHRLGPITAELSPRHALGFHEPPFVDWVLGEAGR